jgi:hypothetical protein
MSFPFDAGKVNKSKETNQADDEKPKASRPSLTIVK